MNQCFSRDSFEQMVERYKCDLNRVRQKASAPPERPFLPDLPLPADRIPPCEPPVPWTPACSAEKTADLGGDYVPCPAQAPAPEPLPAPETLPPRDETPADWGEPRCRAFPPPAPGEAEAAREPQEAEEPAAPEESPPPCSPELLQPYVEQEAPEVAAQAAGAPDAPRARDKEGAQGPRGTVAVTATAGRGALPIEGAQVTVSQLAADGGETLWAIAETGPDGRARPVEVPALPAALSLQPGDDRPYLTYHIRVDMPGYFAFHARGVPVYEGVTAVQNADLVPLPEGPRDA